MSGGFPVGQGSQTCLVVSIWYLHAESGASYLKRSFSLSGGRAQAPLCLTYIPDDS